MGSQTPICSGAGTGVRRYVLGPDPDERWSFLDSNGTINSPHTDREGTMIAMSNNAQAVGKYAYDAYGQNSSSASDVGPGVASYLYRYTGQRLDPHTGLYDYKAREYSPGLGRFLQPDPVGYKDDLNLYAYVKDDPIDHTDPTGKWLWPWEKPITVVGGTPAGNKAVQTAVDRGAKTPRGQSLVKQIIGGIFHGNPITVHVTDNNTARSETPGSNVEVDPNFHPKINTTAGVQAAPTDRIVWHDIGHAVTGTEDSGPGRMDNVRQNENPIAQSLGEPARTTYSTPPQ
jgi:RHS repeat-associated protein